MRKYDRHYPGNETYRRIGSETEYTSPYDDAYYTDPGEIPTGRLLGRVTADELIAYPFAHYVDREEYPNPWLRNGAQVYHDYGSLLDSKLIEHTRLTPPATRAKRRVEKLHTFENEHNPVANVHWDSITAKDGEKMDDFWL